MTLPALAVAAAVVTIKVCKLTSGLTRRVVGTRLARRRPRLAMLGEESRADRIDGNWVSYFSVCVYCMHFRLDLFDFGVAISSTRCHDFLPCRFLGVVCMLDASRNAFYTPELFRSADSRRKKKPFPIPHALPSSSHRKHPIHLLLLNNPTRTHPSLEKPSQTTPSNLPLTSPETHIPASNPLTPSPPLSSPVDTRLSAASPR